MSKEKSSSYQSDLLNGDSGIRSKKTRDTGVDGLHDENLFDEDENAAGDKINAATGLPYDNSTMKDETHMQTSGTGYEIAGGEGSDDVMGSLPKDFDEAAKWLRKHDDHPGGHDHMSDVA